MNCSLSVSDESEISVSEESVSEESVSEESKVGVNLEDKTEDEVGIKVDSESVESGENESERCLVKFIKLVKWECSVIRSFFGSNFE